MTGLTVCRREGSRDAIVRDAALAGDERREERDHESAKGWCRTGDGPWDRDGEGAMRAVAQESADDVRAVSTVTGVKVRDTTVCGLAVLGDRPRLEARGLGVDAWTTGAGVGDGVLPSYDIQVRRFA